MTCRPASLRVLSNEALHIRPHRNRFGFETVRARARGLARTGAGSLSGARKEGPDTRPFCRCKYTPPSHTFRGPSCPAPGQAGAGIRVGVCVKVGGRHRPPHWGAPPAHPPAPSRPSLRTAPVRLTSVFQRPSAAAARCWRFRDSLPVGNTGFAQRFARATLMRVLADNSELTCGVISKEYIIRTGPAGMQPAVAVRTGRNPRPEPRSGSGFRLGPGLGPDPEDSAALTGGAAPVESGSEQTGRVTRPGPHTEQSLLIRPQVEQTTRARA